MSQKNVLNDSVTFRINKHDWEQFKNKCDKYNMPASQVLRQFMIKFDENISISDLFEED